MSVATTDAGSSLPLVLPESFWTYLGFQIPSSQVDELRIAQYHHRYGVWRRTEWSDGLYMTLRRDDESCRVEVSKIRSSVSWTDVDKNVQFCLQTGRIAAIVRYSSRKRRYFGIRAVLTRAMGCWYGRRKQRRDATAQALDELRILIPDLCPLVVSYIGSV